MPRFPVLLAILSLTALPLTVFPLASAQGAPRAHPAAHSGPAPLDGRWRLEALSSEGGGRGLLPGGQLTISRGRISGSYGCGRFGGTLAARHNRARARVQNLPSPAGARCLYVVRASLVDGLNAATQYTVSPRHLILFSDSARVVLERVGRPARR